MDPNRLDDLARVLGSGQSRRHILKTLAGGALAAAAGVIGFDHVEAAAVKRPMDAVCSKNADCRSRVCLPRNRTGRRVCGCGNSGECPTPADQCHVAACMTGRCSTSPAPDGSACDDGDPTTCHDVCESGTCTAGSAACGGACCDAGDVCLADACQACVEDGLALPGGCTIDTVSACCSGHCSGACCGDSCCVADGAVLSGGCNIDTVSTCCSGHCSGACCGDSCA